MRHLKPNLGQFLCCVNILPANSYTFVLKFAGIGPKCKNSPFLKITFFKLCLWKYAFLTELRQLTQHLKPNLGQFLCCVNILRAKSYGFADRVPKCKNSPFLKITFFKLCLWKYAFLTELRQLTRHLKPNLGQFLCCVNILPANSYTLVLKFAGIGPKCKNSTFLDITFFLLCVWKDAFLTELR